MNILVNGILGHMGQEVARLARAGCRGAHLIGGIDPCGGGEEASVWPCLSDLPPSLAISCIVDFSHHAGVTSLLEYAKSRHLPVVIATTGHTTEEIATIVDAARHVPLFFSANMSYGVALLVALARQVARAMPEADIEIIEKHHNQKLDAPSGTALMLAKELCHVRAGAYPMIGRRGRTKRRMGEIGIHAVRMGGNPGAHEVMIGTESETICLRHEAHSRALYAEGALVAAEFILACPPGLYDMKSLVAAGNRELALC